MQPHVDVPTGGECASVTFDSARPDRDVCVGLDGPQLVLLDPTTLDMLAAFAAAAAQPGRRQPVHRLLRRRLLLPRQPGPRGRSRPPRGTSGSCGETAGGRASRSSATTTSRAPCSPGDKIISALPDWSGRIWFVSTQGRGRHVDPATGAVQLARPAARRSATRSRSTRPAASTSSPTRRCTASTPARAARRGHLARDVREHRHREAGPDRGRLGHHPTLMGATYVAITDNADPMDVVVYRRAQDVPGRAGLHASRCSRRARAPPTSR